MFLSLVSSSTISDWEKEVTGAANLYIGIFLFVVDAVGAVWEVALLIDFCWITTPNGNYDYGG